MNNLFQGYLGKTNRGAPANGVTAKELGYDGGIRTTWINFANILLPLTDEAGVVAYGGLKIYDAPLGVLKVFGGSSDLDITKTSAGVNADWDGDFGVGTVTASNNATLASTEQNIIPTSATPQAVAGVTTADSYGGTEAVLDGRVTAVDFFINFLIDDADHNVTGTACSLILNGWVKIHWIML